MPRRFVAAHDEVPGVLGHLGHGEHHVLRRDAQQGQAAPCTRSRLDPSRDERMVQCLAGACRPGSAPVAVVGQQAQAHHLPPLVDVGIIDPRHHRPRRVKGIDRATQQGQTELVAQHVIAVLAIVDETDPQRPAGPLAADIDPRLARLLLAVRPPLDPAIGRRGGHLRPRQAQREGKLERFQLFVPVDGQRDIHHTLARVQGVFLRDL